MTKVFLVKRFFTVILTISLFTLAVMFLLTTLNKSINNQPISDNFTVLLSNKSEPKSSNHVITKNRNDKDNASMELKYILLWTPAKNVPFVYMGTGQQGFIERGCPYTNCYVTDNRKIFGDDITKFDVIAFAGPQVVHMNFQSLPQKRSPHQKYAFATIESADNYPVCSNKFDGYFNWTWTYRLDSEVRWGYMVIQDQYNKVVGPNKEMNWIKLEDMDSVDNKTKNILKSKTKAAAWFVSNCYSRSNRGKFVKDLQKELEKYNLKVDVYGNCGPLKCSRNNEAACFDVIKRDYYFYLSFENSFSEDYVTEKLLNAVQNYAVPIVFGAANYSRFLPEHSYLNARELGARDLAAKMNQLILNLDEYYDYFRWKKYYSYHRKMESVDTDEYCLFCTILNKREMVNENKVYQKFKEWWDPPNRC